MAGNRDDPPVENHSVGSSSQRERYGELVDLSVDELQDLATCRQLEGRSRMGKDELLVALFGEQY